MHAVDPNRMLTQLRGERPRHPGDGVLASGVVNHERLQLDSSRRADQYDRTAAATVDDRLRTGHHGVPRARHVDVHHVAERLRRDRVPRGGGRDSGIGDDDVESPEFGDTGVDGFAHAVKVAGVDGGGDDATAGGFDEARRFLQILLRRRGIRGAGRQFAREIDRDDVGTF